MKNRIFRYEDCWVCKVKRTIQWGIGYACRNPTCGRGPHRWLVPPHVQWVEWSRGLALEEVG